MHAELFLPSSAVVPAVSALVYEYISIFASFKARAYIVS